MKLVWKVVGARFRTWTISGDRFSELTSETIVWHTQASSSTFSELFVEKMGVEAKT
jgi:hypothetical protein